MFHLLKKYQDHSPCSLVHKVVLYRGKSTVYIFIEAIVKEMNYIIYIYIILYYIYILYYYIYIYIYYIYYIILYIKLYINKKAF